MPPFRALRDVENHLRTLFAGGVPWSPRLQRLRDSIDYWTRVVRLRKGVNTSRIKLKRLAKKIGNWSGPPVDLVTAVDKLKEAYSEYYTNRKNAVLWRNEHNQHLVEALLAEGLPGNSCAKAITNRMIREQQQRAQGAAAKAIRQRNNRKPVTMAIATDENGNEVICDTQETMVKAMAASNLARQQMCVDTPFMTMPLLGDLGYLADTPAAAEIINGTYEVPEGTNKYAAEFIAELQMPAAIRDIGPLDCNITPEENKSAWRKQNERTGCEPSSLNFSHYKAASQHPRLNAIDTTYRNILFQVGITSKSHETITDIEILKKLNELRVEKMRLLQMMDPEYQINNKMIGRRVLAHAEKAGEVAEDQHGSRKNHKAITACLNKKVLCDILRQKKRTGAIAMNDAKGCYDRISHPVAILMFDR